MNLFASIAHTETFEIRPKENLRMIIIIMYIKL